MRLPGIFTSPQDHSPLPLTRKDFYELAQRCHAYALDLARHDQSRVSLKHCHEFNSWLTILRRYDTLAPRLRGLTPARPIARWQVMILAVVLWLILVVALPVGGVRMAQPVMQFGFLLGLIVLYFAPERLYGTTVELIEGKVLRVVDALDALLLDGKMEFTEAAFFQVKETLQDARRELRQQIDLAHRRL